MRDDELRSLERDLAATGSTSARLAYARALARAGRADDALEALLPGREDATVRRELARLPHWSRAESGPFGSRATDVRPLETAPRVRWRWTAPGTARGEPQLLAGPLGAVVSVTLDREGGSRATILSPDGTPVRSWERERGAAPLALEQGLVLDPRAAGVFAIDPVTGDERVLLEAGATSLTAEASCVRALLVVPEDEDLRVHELVNGACVPGFRLPRPRTAVFRTARHATATASRVFLSAPGFGRGLVFTAFDRASGAELWRSQRLLAADDAGTLALEVGVAARTAAGKREWEVGDEILGTVHVLGPTFVLGELTSPVEGESSLVLLDRSTGDVRGRPPGRGARELSVARDFVSRVEREWHDEGGEPLGHPRDVIIGVTLAGETRWRFEVDWERGVVLKLAPVHRRLYVLTSEASVLCLD